MMMDPASAAAEIPQLGVDPVSITHPRCVDTNRLWHSPMLPYAVSKVLDDDNLLIEILVRLGFPTTLVRAALVCKRWLCHASDPVFLCRFRKLHPPRLLGFYLGVRPLSRGYRTTHLCFVPMLPQPAELTVIARRVASYSLDTYHNVWIEDCQNGSILIRGCKYGTSTFGAGPSSRLINYGEILCPLGPKGVVTIAPCPPHDPPMGNSFLHIDYTLFKKGGQALSYLCLFQGREKSVAQVYMLENGVWCMHTSSMAQHLCRTKGVRPLLADNKIYIATGMRDILVLDLKASSFSKFQLPEGVKYRKSSTMFSRADDDSRVYLIHLKQFKLCIWLHNGNNWLLQDAICLREMCSNLRTSDWTVSIAYATIVKIIQVGESAQSACLQIGQYILYLDIKCRVMHRVYEMEEHNQPYLGGIYPLMMIWPPTFPVLKDDPARFNFYPLGYATITYLFVVIIEVPSSIYKRNESYPFNYDPQSIISQIVSTWYFLECCCIIDLFMLNPVDTHIDFSDLYIAFCTSSHILVFSLVFLF